MPLSTVTITGSWVTPNNTPASGTVTITPLAEVVGGGQIVADVPVVVTLSGGAISQVMVNNTQVTSLRYQITEQITGAATVTYVVVPTGSTLDLSTASRLPWAPFTPNPNWPLLVFNADFTQGPPHLPGAAAMSLNAASRRNTVTQVEISRGRQYELDQVQAGTATITVIDPLEQLHPNNTSSPFNTGGNTIDSYRCTQVGAFWNTATNDMTGNLFQTSTPIPGQPVGYAVYGIGSGFDPSFENWFLQQDNTGGTTMMVSTDHADGTHTVWKITVQSSINNAGWVPRVQAGSTYTATVDVWAATGQAVTVGWNGSTPVTTSVTGNAAFQTVTVTFTPTAADFYQPAVLYAQAPSGVFPVSFYVSNWRLAGSQPGWTSSGSPTTTYTTVAPHSGGYNLSVSAPGSTNSVSVPMPTVPQVTYTLTAYVQAVGAGTVATMTVGAVAASTTSVGSYQRLQVTFTAADAVTTAVWSVTGSSYPAVFYVDDMQLEIGTVPSTYSTSGPAWFPLYTGYIERYPLQWDMQGTRGVRPLTCVDALSILSRTEISQSYAATIAADNPTMVIPYNDQALPQAVQLPQGGTTATGYQHLGTQGAVNFAGDTFLDASPAVVVTQQNTRPVTSGNTAYLTFLGTIGGVLPISPQSFTIECWVRLVAGAVYFGAASVPSTENLDAEPFGAADYVGWYTSGGFLCWRYGDTLTSSIGRLPASGLFTGFPDSQWHYLAVRLVGSNGLNAVTDNVIGGIATLSPPPVGVFVINNVFIEAQTYTLDPVCTLAVSNLACYTTSLSNTQILNHYNRGIGYTGELAGNRVQRLLQQYWGGPGNFSSGKRQLASDVNYNSRFVLDVLQEIQETERGLVYCNVNGWVIFESSHTRYVNSPTPMWVFGENPSGSVPVEYPYTELQEVLDPTYTFTQANLTRPDNLNFQPLPNPLPTNPPYGQRVLTQEVQVNTDYDLNQAATFYLKRYGKPVVRVETLTLNPAANPALWPVVLSLEISQQITVKRRTSAGLTTSANYYIEQITHHIDASRSEWLVSLQCSPVYNANAWILGDSTYGVLGSTTIPVY